MRRIGFQKNIPRKPTKRRRQERIRWWGRGENDLFLISKTIITITTTTTLNKTKNIRRIYEEYTKKKKERKTNSSLA